MDWSNERYVRVYTRDTTTWKLMDWRGRVVLMLMLRKVDRSGVIDVGDDGVAGLAAVLELPLEIVEAGIDQLTKRRTVEHSGSAFVMPNFLEAQEAAQSDAQRKRVSRERRRDLVRAGLRPDQRRPVVYFIQGDTGGPIKIGHTDDVAARLVSLQTGHHSTLTILATMSGGEDLEAQIHARFAHIRKRGEWFEDTEELRSFIAVAARDQSRIVTVTQRDESQAVTPIRSEPVPDRSGDPPPARAIPPTAAPGHVAPAPAPIAPAMSPPLAPCEDIARTDSLDDLWAEFELERQRVAVALRIELLPLAVHDRGRSDLAHALSSAAAAGQRDVEVRRIRRAIAVAGAEAEGYQDCQWLTGAVFTADNLRRQGSTTPAKARAAAAEKRLAAQQRAARANGSQPAIAQTRRSGPSPEVLAARRAAEAAASPAELAAELAAARARDPSAIGHDARAGPSPSPPTSATDEQPPAKAAT